MPRILAIVLALTSALSMTCYGQSPADAPQILRAQVEQMKTAERGPFSRIRWFCKDGMVLPPEPFACKPHGGGVQHGEWNQQVADMRSAGYYIANVYADIDAAVFVQNPNYREILKQMLIEQFLISVDEGWILRRARYYRGALQEEGERLGARRLLYKLVEDPSWYRQRYLVLNRAAALLVHGRETVAISKVRQLSMSLSDSDPGFAELRTKIHVRPDAADAVSVRSYAAAIEDPVQAEKYTQLASTIEAVYSSHGLDQRLAELARPSAALPALHTVIMQAQAELANAVDAGRRYAVTAKLIMALRDRALDPSGPALRVAILDTILAAADEHFVAATTLRERLDSSSRRELLDWLEQGSQALYGTGVISGRQRDALSDMFTKLDDARVDLGSYKHSLDYAGLVPGWGSQQFRFFSMMRCGI